MTSELIMRKDEINSFTFTVNMSGEPKEVCRFVVTEDQHLHIVVNETIPMTEAARMFIALIKDQLDALNSGELKVLSPSGDH